MPSRGRLNTTARRYKDRPDTFRTDLVQNSETPEESAFYETSKSFKIMFRPKDMLTGLFQQRTNWIRSIMRLEMSGLELFYWQDSRMITAPWLWVWRTQAPRWQEILSKPRCCRIFSITPQERVTKTTPLCLSIVMQQTTVNQVKQVILIIKSPKVRDVLRAISMVTLLEIAKIQAKNHNHMHDTDTHTHQNEWDAEWMGLRPAPGGYSR